MDHDRTTDYAGHDHCARRIHTDIIQRLGPCISNLHPQPIVDVAIESELQSVIVRLSAIGHQSQEWELWILVKESFCVQ